MYPRRSEGPTKITATRESTDAARTPRSAAKYAVEAIGTFFLVFTAGAAAGGGNSLAPLAIGGVLMVMVYAGGRISGGHYNPAVTLAMLVLRKISTRDAAWYWIVQFGTGLIAATAVRWIVDPARATTEATLTQPSHNPAAVFGVEVLFTFALCFVVLNVTASKQHSENDYYGLAIGFTVVSGAFAVGDVSGGAFNPSVTVGAAAAGLFAWPTLWVYLTAQGVAAIGAGIVFGALGVDDDGDRSSVDRVHAPRRRKTA